jgi:peptidoglycan hydrolase FlgJ
MDALGQIGNAQDAFLAGLQRQVSAQAAATQNLAKADSGSRLEQANMEGVREAAQDFEAFFIGQMMEQMMSGMESDPMFGGGQGEEVWRSMLTQEYGKEVAKSGRLGIADHVMSAMLRAQEERSTTQNTAAAQSADTKTVTESPEDDAQKLAAVAASASTIRR